VTIVSARKATTRFLSLRHHKAGSVVTIHSRMVTYEWPLNEPAKRSICVQMSLALSSAKAQASTTNHSSHLEAERRVS
jgi:hypothetical protein